ncbi:VanZ family protein [Stutzerimonas xanthomarina]|uniref:VanZ family protein n=1 Tax=Stutzerimonas xanthomarina TaxID=271420 RepID=UPI003AA97511
MRYWRFLPLLAVTAILLYAGLRPDPVPQVFDQQDKLHHLLGFAALAFSMRLALPRWSVGWIFSLCLATALLIELAQGYQPHRFASLEDMVANLLGVGTGIVSSVAWRGICRRWARHQHPITAVQIAVKGRA